MKTIYDTNKHLVFLVIKLKKDIEQTKTTILNKIDEKILKFKE